MGPARPVPRLCFDRERPIWSRAVPPHGYEVASLEGVSSHNSPTLARITPFNFSTCAPLSAGSLTLLRPVLCPTGDTVPRFVGRPPSRSGTRGREPSDPMSCAKGLTIHKETVESEAPLRRESRESPSQTLPGETSIFPRWLGLHRTRPAPVDRHHRPSSVERLERTTGCKGRRRHAHSGKAASLWPRPRSGASASPRDSRPARAAESPLVACTIDASRRSHTKRS